MKKYLVLKIVFLVFSLVFSSAFATLKMTEQEASDLSKKIQSELKKQNSPGISYAITHGNELIFIGSEGYSNVNEKRPFSNTTRTSLGSISKTYTALAIYKLIDEKDGFSLNTKLTGVLPWLESIRPELKDIKIKHLLAHTSGLQRSLGRNSIADFDFIYSQLSYGPSFKEIKDIFIDIERMYPQAGVLPQYSNFGYAVLGLVISEIAGQTGFNFKSDLVEERIAEYIRAKIISPIGASSNTDLMVGSRNKSLDATVYTGTHELKGKLIRYEWPQISHLGMALTHSGVISDVLGVSKLAVHLDDMITGRRFDTISRTSFRNMSRFASRSFNLENPEESAHGYSVGGLLFEKFTISGRDFVAAGHTGTGYGARALMYLDPTTGLGVSLIINDKTSNRHAFANILFESVSNKIQVDKTRMSKDFSINYSAVQAAMSQKKSVSKLQKSMLPDVSKPATLENLYTQIKSKGVDSRTAQRVLNNLMTTEFTSASFGQGWDRHFIFVDSEGDEINDLSTVSVKSMKDITVKGFSGSREIPLFFDPNPQPGKSQIREAFVPVFLAFAFMQWDLDFDMVSGEINYLIHDETFYLKARAKNSQQDVFDYAPKIFL